MRHWERSVETGDQELERALLALGRSIAYPSPEGSLARVVRARLEERPAAATRKWSGGLRAQRVAPLRRGLVLALLLVLAAVSVAVGIGIGLPGLRITFVSSLPVAATPTSSVSTAGTVGATLGLGEPTTLGDARSLAGFPLRVPSLAELGEPDAVYIAPARIGRRVELVYGSRAGHPAPTGNDVAVLVTQFQGDTEPDAAKKLVARGTQVRFLSVSGDEGYWISGRPHAVTYGEGREPYRLAGNVLVWQRGDVVYRIESALDLATVLRIAESLR